MDEGQELNILVTGGLGFIGSHTVIELCETKAYKRIIIVDNLSNTTEKVLDRIQEIITFKDTEIIFEKLDCLNLEDLEHNIFEKYAIHEIIHFAGFKAVGESVEEPLMYYENNLMSSVNLLKLVKKSEGVCKSFLFSSSATVYNDLECVEESPTGPISPYGRTKFMVEQILKDYSYTDHELFSVSLRYFNPIGAHPSGKIGEAPQMANNLMPVIQEVACGKREKLKVFGNDYDTADGTGMRDYIHVVDLAQAHVEALKYMRANHSEIQGQKYDVFNIGTGKPTSVFQLVQAFEEQTDVKIPYEIVDRREGDSPIFYAVTDKAKRLLKWESKYTINDACKHSWNWIKDNPNGVE